jgi:sugar phosphate isomerase/epimerase
MFSSLNPGHVGISVGFRDGLALAERHGFGGFDAQLPQLHAVGGTRADLQGLTRDLLVHVHVDDAPAGVPLAELLDDRRKLPCTTGVIDIDGFMQALANAGYDGPVTAEPFDSALNALPAEESAALTARATRAAVARGVRSIV